MANPWYHFGTVVWLCDYYCVVGFENLAMASGWVYDLHQFGPGQFQTVKYSISDNRIDIRYLLYGFLLWSLIMVIIYVKIIIVEFNFVYESNL